jgi:ABC-type polar amino acid transport system ATPase subunit
MLEIKNVSKSFKDKKILDNVNVSVKKGEVAFFLGSSGVGKSTLLRILNNLETYDSGTILFNGKPLDITEVNNKHIIGMVFQHFNLFANMTVIDNITFALKHVKGMDCQKAEQRAYELLKEYKLDDKAHSYINKLSGGQKQRLSIARTLALKPHIICMDEPTSALDPRLTNDVARNIMKLSENGYTVLVASHDTTLIDKINCTLHLMDKGSIKESALSQDLLNNPSSYPHLQSFIMGHAEKDRSTENNDTKAQ